MANEFIGTGWSFPILPDATGSLGYVSGNLNVEQSLRILASPSSQCIANRRASR